MRIRRCWVLAAKLIAVMYLASVTGLSQQSAKPQPAQTSGPVKSIVLPQFPADVPTGPHVETYRKDCLLCHSTRYVIMQPPFPQAVWEKEVKKMVDAYGAVIPEAEQRQIVEYLVAVRGAAESKDSKP